MIIECYYIFDVPFLKGKGKPGLPQCCACFSKCLYFIDFILMPRCFFNTHWENLYDLNHQLHSHWGCGWCIHKFPKVSLEWNMYWAPCLFVAICAWPRCSCPPAGQERKWGWNIHYCCTTAGIMLKLLIDPNWLLKCFVWNWVAEVQGEQKIYIYIYSMGSRNGFIGMYHIFMLWFVLLQTPSRGDSWLETPWQHRITSITAVVITTCALWSCFMFICACCQASQLIFRNVLTTLSSPVLPSGPPNLPIFFFLLRHSDKPLVFAGDVISTWRFNAAATRGRTWLINSGRQKDEAARGGRRACLRDSR